MQTHPIRPSLVPFIQVETSHQQPFASDFAQRRDSLLERPELVFVWSEGLVHESREAGVKRRGLLFDGHNEGFSGMGREELVQQGEEGGEGRPLWSWAMIHYA